MSNLCGSMETGNSSDSQDSLHSVVVQSITHSWLLLLWVHFIKWVSDGFGVCLKWGKKPYLTKAVHMIRSYRFLLLLISLSSVSQPWKVWKKQVIYCSVSLCLPWVTQTELQMLLCVTMSQPEPKRPGEESLLPGSQLTSVEHIHMCSRHTQRLFRPCWLYTAARDPAPQRPKML